MSEPRETGTGGTAAAGSLGRAGTSELLPCVAGAPLVDHHCHGVVRADLDRTAFEELLTEADTVSPLGSSLFDSLIGLAVRQRCAPVLDLPPHVDPEGYLARRAELGADEVNRRFLRATGITTFLVDGGFQPAEVTSAARLGALAGAPAREIVRLETVAEDVLRSGTDAAGFAAHCAAALASSTAVGAKSIAAYRVGLRLSGERPAGAEVRAAAGRALSEADTYGSVRLTEEAVHRFLIWQAIDLGLPVQFHTGYGDAEENLADCDPLLLTDLLRATRPAGVPIMLLHCYPFHRNAGYLAQVFRHVFVDVGLATHNVGRRAAAVLAEALELAPFGKFLFSTDAFGLAEHYHLGAGLFRAALSDFLRAGLADGALTMADAEHVTDLICAENARRAYRLDA